MSTRIALHGFGPLARGITRIVLSQPQRGLEIAAIGERSQPGRLAHLLRHDSAYGPYPGEVEEDERGLVVNGRAIPVVDRLLQERGARPWAELGIELVVETTGLFRSADKLMAHLEGGAGRVLLAAAPRSADIPTLFVTRDLEPTAAPMVAAGSATGVALHPLACFLDRAWGLEALHGTVLAPLSEDQRHFDDLHNPCAWRGRPAMGNLIPTTQGVGRSLLHAYPQLRGRLLLQNLRAPVAQVGCLNLVAHTREPLDRHGFILAAEVAAQGPLRGLMATCDEALVSTDFRGRGESVVLDLQSIDCGTDPRVVSFRAWYDATWGYASRLVDLAALLGRGVA
jgi:glyceraldehyde 3-phosphate dehydrogenase